MLSTSKIRIDLAAIEQNMHVLRDGVGEHCQLCPVIKADAYGLGACRIAPVLCHSGADMLAVFSPAQAIDLTRHVNRPVLVLMPIETKEALEPLRPLLVSGRLQLVVHGVSHMASLEQIASRLGVVVPVHLEIDTGMSRGGASLQESPQVLEQIARSRWIRLSGIMTHLASAADDEVACDRQMDAFDVFCSTHQALIPPECVVHLTNTFALLRHKRFHKSMARFGLAWAGFGFDDEEQPHQLDSSRLRPVFTWESSIIHVKTIRKGEQVGYGGGWIAGRDSVIGLVPVGYADGYPRGTFGGRDGPVAHVRIKLLSDGSGLHRHAPVIGAVNMDQIIIDLTDLAELAHQPRGGVGTGVELISNDADAPNSLWLMARGAGMSPHELLCRLNPRIPRIIEQQTRSTFVSEPIEFKA
ncbi:MAG: alanine racemase [Phycisphaerae bacterium]|nr:alanine racemase [Phycisphaerae bacterium]